MLVCRLEIWPFGEEDRKRDLGTLCISNDATGDPETGNYVVSLDVPEPGEGATVTVKNFDRAKGAWALVGECLKKLGRVDALPMFGAGVTTVAAARRRAK